MDVGSVAKLNATVAYQEGIFESVKVKGSIQSRKGRAKRGAPPWGSGGI